MRALFHVYITYVVESVCDTLAAVSVWLIRDNSVYLELERLYSSLHLRFLAHASTISVDFGLVNSNVARDRGTVRPGDYYNVEIITTSN